jgi:hypothetical protein
MVRCAAGFLSTAHQFTEVKQMSAYRSSAVLFGLVLFLVLAGSALATEIKGAAILNHPCGKVAVKHMGLVHAGKIEEASKLGTKQMQDEWKAMPASDRTMMSEMMKATSASEADFSARIKAGGVLVIEGKNATLTVKQEHKDASGSTTETTTEKYLIDGPYCMITR